jgi:hypothetical protein
MRGPQPTGPLRKTSFWLGSILSSWVSDHSMLDLRYATCRTPRLCKSSRTWRRAWMSHQYLRRNCSLSRRSYLAGGAW